MNIEQTKWYPDKKGYLIDNKGRLKHRWVWAVEHGIPYASVPMLDHINRDVKDNRLCNLRPTNKVLNGNNSSYRDKGSVQKVNRKVGCKWKSRLRYRMKDYHLGTFSKKSRARLVSRVIKQFLMTLEEAIL